MTALEMLLTLVVAAATGVFLLGKCFFLAPYRAGWLMMAANIVYEALFKRLHWTRAKVTACSLC